MKPLQLLLFTVAITSLFTFNQCKKNKNEEPQLPPATTTGAMTFGCKVDGKVFVPRDGRGRESVKKPSHFYSHPGYLSENDCHLNDSQGSLLAFFTV